MDKQIVSGMDGSEAVLSDHLDHIQLEVVAGRDNLFTPDDVQELIDWLCEWKEQWNISQEEFEKHKADNRNRIAGVKIPVEGLK